MQRDLAFVVPEALAVGEVLAKVGEWGGAHLVGCDLFDVFRGAQIGSGMKSLAFRLKFQSQERTLTDAEADAVIQHVITMMSQTFDARLRS